MRLREPVPTDVGFVVESWMQSYRATLERSRRLEDDEYFRTASERINALLARPTVDLVVLAPDDPEDLYTVHGWACFEGATLHYVYVKKDDREKGAARTLVGDRPVAHYSHLTPRIQERRLPPHWLPTLKGRIL